MEDTFQERQKNGVGLKTKESGVCKCRRLNWPLYSNGRLTGFE